MSKSDFGKKKIRSRPCVKKPLETSVKHPKCCNHYLDKERTHIVLLNKSVSKTKVSDNIWKGLKKFTEELVVLTIYRSI